MAGIFKTSKGIQSDCSKPQCIRCFLWELESLEQQLTTRGVITAFFISQILRKGEYLVSHRSGGGSKLCGDLGCIQKNLMCL